MKQRQGFHIALIVWGLVLAAGGVRLGWLYAQEPAARPPVAETSKSEAPQGSTSEGVSAADELALEESKIADKYARLEQTMLKMADLEEATNPRRAALLRRAVEQSKERLTKTELESVVKLLNQKQLTRALTGQGEVQSDLKALLELLMSEDRGDRLKSEQARIKEYIKDLEKMIRIQKALQARTEGDANAKGLSKEQGDLAQRAEELAKKIKKNEEGDAPESSSEDKEGKGDKSAEENKGEKQPGENSKEPMKGEKDGEGSDKKGEEGKNSEGKNSEGKNNEGKSPEGKTGEKGNSGDKKGDDKKGDKSAEKGEDKKADDKKGDDKSGNKSDDKKGEKGEPSDANKSEGSKSKEGKNGKSSKSKSKSKGGEPKDGEPQDGQPDDSQQQDQQQDQQSQNPARKRIEQAEQKMRDAQKKLEEAKRKESVEDQRQAKEELEKAKAELEEILRQMREEEVARTLAALEARFKKMLEMQLKVYESTRRMDQITEESRGEVFVVQAARLGVDERKIGVEAQKALTLLKEEGSSVAFPATVDQMHEDMESVATRLADTKVDEITIGYEEDIIAALEEMIDALQKAQQDLEKKKQQQQQQQQQQPQQDQPLVDEIAELKMIKSLQERVNKRTTRYSRLLEDDQDPVGQANAAELVDAIRKLGERQQEVYRITRDLVLGKNK